MHRLHVHVRKLVNAGYKVRYHGCVPPILLAASVLAVLLLQPVHVDHGSWHRGSSGRLCASGVTQVGIVRQQETAAIKKAEGSRGTFERKLSAVYTSATLEASPLHPSCGDAISSDLVSVNQEAGFDSDVIGRHAGTIPCIRNAMRTRAPHDSSKQAPHKPDNPVYEQPASTAPQAGDAVDVGELGTERGDMGWTSAGLSAHLVVLVEGGAAKAAAGAVQIGLVALEISTGLVLYSQFE